jgi:enoyl-CoA hydratase/carnithine racemase
MLMSEESPRPSDLVIYQLERQGLEAIALIGMNHAPVNSFSLALRKALCAAFQRARDDDQVRAVVFHGCGRGFSAGGDINEFGTPEAIADPGLSLHVHPLIEGLGKPVIAAVHGLAMGGGLETALVCHYRVAEIDTRIALPEVRLGTLPLSGSQRLPRVVGLARAIEMILGGETFSAGDFEDTPLFDQVVGRGQSLTAAIALARELISMPEPALPLIRDLPAPCELASGQITHARLQISQQSGGPAHYAALEAIEAAVEAAHFDAGMTKARALYLKLMASSQVRGARERFFSRDKSRD